MRVSARWIWSTPRRCGAREALPDEGATRRVAEVFGVLSDPTRARIVYALSVEELCVCDVAALAGLSVSRSTVCRAIAYMGPTRIKGDVSPPSATSS